MQLRHLLLLAALCASSLAAHADGVGTPVTGSLSFGSGINYFNPSNGYVPTGYGNTASATTPIGAGVEFGFDDGANLDTADFTGTTLSISDVSGIAGAGSFEMVFTDPAFMGFTQDSNNSGFTYTFSGDTLHVFFEGTGTAGTYTTTFSYETTAVTPEPSSLFLLGTGVLGLAGVVRRRVMA